MPMRRAFALVPALLLASLCVAVALLCHAAAALAGASAVTASCRDRGKLGALAAARMGCGMVAQSLGPDMRWSGMDPAGVAWAARKVRAGPGLDETWEIHSLSGGFRDDRGVGLAWSVEDLSCRADIAAPILARERSGVIARKPRMRQRLASGATQPDATAGVLAAASVSDVAALRSRSGLSAPASTTAGTRSLLIDPETGVGT